MNLKHGETVTLELICWSENKWIPVEGEIVELGGSTFLKHRDKRFNGGGRGTSAVDGYYYWILFPVLENTDWRLPKAQNEDKATPSDKLSVAERAIGDIIRERSRQDEKWGQQNHSLAWWYIILAEEFGELAQTLLETHFDNGPAERRKGGLDNIKKELVHTAAVAAAMLEYIYRAENTPGGPTI
jgi:hypothetical protein